jgi:two-component system LytT family sensor kinase
MEPGLYRIRWRSQEFLLVTILTLLAIGGYIRPIFETSPEHLTEWYGLRFTEMHLSFDYYRNILFPHIGFLLLLYGCYCWMYFYIIPDFLRGLPSGNPVPYYFRLAMSPGKVIWCLFQVFLLTVALGIGWGNSFSYWGFPEVVDARMTDAMIVGLGLRQVTGWVVGYAVYAVFRDITIRRLQAGEGKNAHWITLLNQATGFCLIYYAVGSIAVHFSFFGKDGRFSDLIFVFLPPIILTVYTNLYWVFPVKKEEKLWLGWRGRAGRRLLVSTGGWLIPFLFYGLPDMGDPIPAWLSLWFGQLVVTTPVSWLIWRQRKDKLMQVQGLQTALGQSEADLQFLRSQINPHFLFNVLNTLYGTALQEGALRTAEGVQKLGDMMRFMLHENHLPQIPMSKEIEYLKNYIALQELRTESAESIRIETTIDEPFPEYQIAPMLLIPFVENGFKHGISLREPSWIKLKLHNEGNRILFEMRNSIHVRKGDDPERARSGIGLKNVLHRLKLLYPNRHEFYMHQDEKEFFVQLSIQP